MDGLVNYRYLNCSCRRFLRLCAGGGGGGGAHCHAGGGGATGGHHLLNYRSSQVGTIPKFYLRVAEQRMGIIYESLSGCNRATSIPSEVFIRGN
jgi:hypothetical protein